jgi:hypothetical protein
MATEGGLLLIVVFGFALLIMRRLDRLGKQIEAVCQVVQLEVAQALHNEDREDELRTEWRELRDGEAKARRQFWWFWGVIGAIAIAWFLLSKG